MATEGLGLLDDELRAVDAADDLGKDEMNLAEFPITALTDYVPRGQHTISFSDGTGSLLITGSDAYGLPTAADADVVVALIQLTKRRSNFRERTVRFTRSELLDILGWPESGKSYRRLTESLFRWSTTSLRYEGTWWDQKGRRKINAVFHILNEVVFYDKADPAQGDGGPLPPSYFTWNKIFLESCQAGNLKRLDVRMYFGLEHASSKRLYRFLDKRLYRDPDQTFDLAEIAFERVGLSRSYVGKKGGINIGKVREKLQPAIEELESRGFLVPMSRDDRYRKEGKGWVVRFIRADGACPLLPPAEDISAPGVPESSEAEPAGPSPAPLLPDLESTDPVTLLVSRGVTRSKAEALVGRFPAERIGEKVEIFDWKRSRETKGMEKNPSGWLVKAIEDDYPAPKRFEPRSDRLAREAAAKEQAVAAAETDRRRRDEGRRRDRDRQNVDDRIAALTPEQYAALEAEALAVAPPEARRQYEAQGVARFRQALLRGIVRDHVAEQIRVEREGPTLF